MRAAHLPNGRFRVRRREAFSSAGNSLKIKGVTLRICLAVFAATGAFLAQAGVPCPSGGAVTEFQLEVEPPQGGEKLPVTMVHRIPAGSKLHYHPGLDQKSKGEVALLIAPRGGTELLVLAGQPDSRHAVWTLPWQPELIGMVYSLF